MRNAPRRLLPRASCGRLARLRGAGQADASAAGLELPNLAGASAISSTPTASTTPATSRGACSSTGGSRLLQRGAPVDARTARQAHSPSSTTHARLAVFFTLWGEMWRRPRIRSSAGSAMRALFTESGDEDAAAMRSPRAAAPGCSSPTSGALARAELQEAVGQAPRTRRLVGRGDGRGRPRTARAGGATSRSRRRTSRGAARIAEAEQDVFTRVVAGNNVARACSRRRHRGRAASTSTTSRSRPGLHYDEGAQYAFEGLSAIAAVRGAWRAGALAAAATVVRQRDRALRRGGLRRSTAAPGDVAGERSRKAWPPVSAREPR
jgi:hypothetical protein